jgi:hypothetical protein
VSEKQIILELKRIQELMGVKTLIKEFILDTGTGVVPQGGTGSGMYDEQGNEVKKTDPDDVRYPTYDLGLPKFMKETEAGIYIKGFNSPPTLIMGPKDGSGPKVWYMTSSTKIEDLLPPAAKSQIKTGTVTNKDGQTIENQKYIEIDDTSNNEKNDKTTGVPKVKLCLPTQEWFDSYSSLGLCYMFENPKTGKKYALLFGTWGTARKSGPKQEMMTGYEAARACYGADNGWEFKVTNVSGPSGKALAPYQEVGGTEFWDPSNKEMFDPRSVNDTFWDKYGIYIEIAIGVAVAIVAPYIAGFLISLAPMIGGAFALIVGGLAGTTYGGVTLLAVLIEIIAESVALAPLIKNQLSRGDDVGAGITAIFCFIPFLTELKPIHNWLKNGISGSFGKAEISGLLDEVAKVDGGWNTIMNVWTDSQRNLWEASLSQQNKKMYQVGITVIKNISERGGTGPEDLGKAVADYMNQNTEIVLKNARQLGYTPIEKAVEDITMAVATMPFSFTSLFTKTGFKASLARGVTTFAPVAMALNGLGKKIKEKFPNEQEQKLKELEEKVKKAFEDLGNNPGQAYQFELMATLYQKLGWLNKIGEVTNLTIDKILDDPKLKTMYDNEVKTVLSDLLNKEAEKRAKEEEKEITQYLLSPSVQKIAATLEILFILQELQINVLPSLLEGLGYTNIQYVDPCCANYSQTEDAQEFTADNDVKGSIVFPKTMKKEDSFKIVVNNQQVWPKI